MSPVECENSAVPDDVSTAHWGSEQYQVTDMIDFVHPQTAFPVSSARTRVASLQEEEHSSWSSLLSRRLVVSVLREGIAKGLVCLGW
ncbi:hypothetical protein M0R45_033200 [Rubus argutus]|uniref:Uncharacterized protein n=1 Tax=Rubus argutus TaxID=59490 RepID=A0AAW1WMI4_RUBAR